MTALELRPAREDDLEFIVRVHREAMRPHVERVFGPWGDAEQRELLLRRTDPATHEIVLADGEPVGCWWIREHPDALELVRVYLLPEAQGRGIGSRLLQQLCARADAAGLPLRLRVLRGNPARRLYARHGFAVRNETDTHVAMAREPGARS